MTAGKGGGLMVKFSYMHLPAYPLSESISLIQKADELGFHAAYAVDETWWKDMWLLFAAAADKTKQIRLGPNVTHVIMRDPAHIVQMVGTLDELTGGRAEIVVSFGNQALLPQHGIDHTGMKPLSRVIEARQVMRTLLDEGAITFEGEFFKYKGLYTFSRPVQQRVPIILGAMGGPRSFEVAGELFEGVHQAVAASKETYQYMIDHVKIGADRAGRDWRELDLGAWVLMTVAEDSASAKEAARLLAAFYFSSMPRQQQERHGISEGDLKPIFDAFAAGDVKKALDLTAPELAEKITIAGTPEEVVAKLKENVLSTGVNHVIAAITDRYLVKAFTGNDIELCPDTREQLQLIHDRVMPALADPVPA
jgi:5,10-methylenetetrahydromethanopterin reductase